MPSIPKGGHAWQNERELSVTVSVLNAANRGPAGYRVASHADLGRHLPIQNTPSDLRRRAEASAFATVGGLCESNGASCSGH
jgi:hypothetical protein